jgi:Na+/phosphate symporter
MSSPNTKKPGTTAPNTTKPVITTPSAALIRAQAEIDNIGQNRYEISEKIDSVMNQKLNEYVKENFSINRFDEEITTSDVYQRDLNTALDRQNTLYIVGTITCATLLITAILIAR